ncbi:MAG: ABC transporter substrate-binding protein [Anaerolineaceae bacterium]
MKTVLKIASIVLMITFLASCAAPTAAPVATSAAPTTADPTVAPTAALTANEQWAKDNGFGPYQAADEDWAAVEAAAIKEGSVCVYANSSKYSKLEEAWTALYPGIKLDCGDTDGITTKMQAEQEAGNVVGDVWFNSDGHLLYGLFTPKQWIWSFMPKGVTEAEVTAERPYAVQRHSVDVWGYNSEIHPDGCPLTNLWQVTEPALSGKIFMEDPLSDPSTMAKFTLFVDHADDLAAAYQTLYGKDWTTDPMAAPDAFGVAPENAGYLFLRKLAANAPVLEPGGDEVDAAYATLGMDATIEPGYGLTGWDSLQAALDGETAMAPCLTVEPVIGIYKSNYVAVANMAPHPNAAKLFIKFILSKDGFKPWNKLGTYPGNTELEAPEGMPAASTIKVWESDDAFAWANTSKVRDFFATELLSSH